MYSTDKGMYESFALNNLMQDHVDRIQAEKQARYDEKIRAEEAQQAEDNKYKKAALKWRELFYSLDKSYDTLDKSYNTLDKSYNTLDKSYDTVKESYNTVSGACEIMKNQAVDRRLSTEVVKLIALEYGVPEEAFSEDNIAKKAKRRFEEWKTERPQTCEIVKPENLPCLNKKSCLSD